VKPIHPYPRPQPTTDGTGTLSHAGGLLLTETVRATGLDQTISAHLTRWRKPRILHDPGKICTDLALALGGDCLADAALLRNQSDLYGPVASDPTVSRTLTALAAEPHQAVAAIRTTRATARQRVWNLAGRTSPAGEEGRVPLDLDATLVTAHSDKEMAAPTWKKTYGFHPLCAFIDHGEQGTGEAAATLLRPGNAGSNTAAGPGPSPAPPPARSSAPCSPRSRPRTAGPWPNRPDTRPPTGSSTYWDGPPWTSRPWPRPCAATSPSTWAPRTWFWSWTRPATSRKAARAWGWPASSGSAM